MSDPLDRFLAEIEPLSLPLSTAVRVARAFEVVLGSCLTTLDKPVSAAEAAAPKRPVGRPKKAKAAQSDAAAPSDAPAPPKAQCIECDEFKGRTAFRRGSRMCIKCEGGKV